MTVDLMPSDREEEVKRFVMQAVGLRATLGAVTALGFMDMKTKELEMGWVFERYTGPGGSVYAHWAVKKGKRLHRVALKLAAMYIFDQLKCGQVLGEVRASEQHVRDMDMRLGFKEVAIIPGYFPKDDLVVYSLKREECVWLPEEMKEAS